MPLSQEKFEILEAFVDGELDPTARAEVEKQLAANPQLRKLLNELTEARDLLSGLPRAKAPADLADAFNTQLERSELFGDKPDESITLHRISRWPQYMSAAAIVFLALGLIGVLYKVVLPHSKPSSAYVINDDSLAGGALNPSDRALATTRPTSAPISVAMLPPTPAPGDRSTTVAAAVDPKSAALAPDVARPMASIDEVRSVQEKLFGTTQPLRERHDEPVVMVVRAEHPDAVNAQLKAYFASNSIAYQQAPDADSLTLEHAKDMQAVDNAAVNAAPAPAAVANSAQNIQQARGGQAQQRAARQNAATPSSEPSSLPTFARNNADVAPQPTPAAPGQAIDPATALGNASPTAGGNLYRAMLTQSQLRELNTQLQAQANQWTEMHAGGTSDMLESASATAKRNAAATEPATRKAEGTGLAKATEREATTQPATQPGDLPREVVIVVPSSSIELPTTQPTTAPANEK